MRFPPQTPIESCQGKTRFFSPALAYRVQRRRQRHNPSRDGETGQVYRCRFCGGWHIGTSAVRAS